VLFFYSSSAKTPDNNTGRRKYEIFHSNKYCKMLLRLENEIFWLCYCSMKRIYYILCCYLQVFVIISLKYSSHSTTKIILYSCYFNTDPLFTLFVFWIFLFQKRRIIIKIIIPYTVRLLMLFNTLEIIYKSALFVF